jgi:hypothetical protein
MEDFENDPDFTELELRIIRGERPTKPKADKAAYMRRYMKERYWRQKQEGKLPKEKITLTVNGVGKSYTRQEKRRITKQR